MLLLFSCSSNSILLLGLGHGLGKSGLLPLQSLVGALQRRGVRLLARQVVLELLEAGREGGALEPLQRGEAGPLDGGRVRRLVRRCQLLVQQGGALAVAAALEREALPHLRGLGRQPGRLGLGRLELELQGLDLLRLGRGTEPHHAPLRGDVHQVLGGGLPGLGEPGAVRVAALRRDLLGLQGHQGARLLEPLVREELQGFGRRRRQRRALALAAALLVLLHIFGGLDRVLVRVTLQHL
mmetsp:Transcript_11168/g.17290  ORF Transcript_11168/g.17290 Transcript_11168/m.17290 type:complete len:239 (-) Transcript_11168:182-898(-)